LADLVCDTTVLQYLHQLELLHLLPVLADGVIVPPAVVTELREGRERGYDVPDPEAISWMEVHAPAHLPSTTPILGPGERGVIALAEADAARVAVLDDRPARALAAEMELPLKGTLGLLVEAKRVGLVPRVAPLIEQLHDLGFYLSDRTRDVVLRMADEA
jgi:predicted nucleic acid-binding protein